MLLDELVVRVAEADIVATTVGTKGPSCSSMNSPVTLWNPSPTLAPASGRPHRKTPRTREAPQRFSLPCKHRAPASNRLGNPQSLRDSRTATDHRQCGCGQRLLAADSTCADIAKHAESATGKTQAAHAMPRLRQPRAITAHNLTTNNAAPDLHALFGDLPTLPLALCADDNPKLWDETVNATVIERNKAICRHCRELDACAALGAEPGPQQTARRRGGPTPWRSEAEGWRRMIPDENSSSVAPTSAPRK